MSVTKEQTGNADMPLIFERSKPGRIAYSLPAPDVPEVNVADVIPPHLLRRTPAELPEVSELDLIRHYTELSRRNHGIDIGFYPLGSCTMKYNPKVNEDVARLPGFTEVHPLQPEETVQGALALMWHLQEYLAEITGMDAVTLQPAAGAHGEWTGLMMIRAYYEARGRNGPRCSSPTRPTGPTRPAPRWPGWRRSPFPRTNADWWTWKP
jgi:Glycine cleavage system protein P (pyridoxal-binding), C-terminal domain